MKNISIPVGKRPRDYVDFKRENLIKSIVDRFEEVVELHPNNVAIRYGDNQHTYQEVNIHANRVAHVLLEKVSDSNLPIAFLFGNSINQIYSILGILKSGKAYLPLDLDFPQTHLEFLLADTETPILLTDTDTIDIAQRFDNPNIEIINIDSLDPGISPGNPDLNIPPESLAVIHYTSGSTGKPKGCKISHKMIIHYVMVTTNSYFTSPSDRLILTTSISFAAALPLLMTGLLNGACYYFYDIKNDGLYNLADYLIKEKISVLSMIPSTFRYFLSQVHEGIIFKDVRMVSNGGEAVLKRDIELFNKFFPSTCYFFNSLSATETTNICQIAIPHGTHIENSVLPVGYEVEDKKVLLLGDGGKEVPRGEIGEIVVESEYISTGYWKRPELTNQKYSEVKGHSGLIQYKTGDLGQKDQDGCLHHLGRKDRMVKIRGLRVDIDGIINALLENPRIKDAYVLAQKIKTGENQLIAYLVLNQTDGNPIDEIKKDLGNTLPSYMIPTRFMVLEKIPKTISGKVDAIALPLPDRTLSIDRSNYKAPSNSLEKELVTIWESLLEVQPIGVKDDFIELGGHSLLVMRLIAIIEERMGTRVPYSALVNIRTIEDLARLMEDKGKLQVWSHLNGLQLKGSKLPFFGIPAAGVTSLSFSNLARFMGESRPFYTFEYVGMDGEAEPQKTVAEIAKYNIELVKSIQPSGPYYLGGMCFGAVVAYEMAHQLCNNNEEVAFLGVLDSRNLPRQKDTIFTKLLKFMVDLNENIFHGRLPFKLRGLDFRIDEKELDQTRIDNVTHVFETHAYAHLCYIAPPLPAKITLFMTDWSKSELLKKRWQSASEMELDVVPIPGVHQSEEQVINNIPTFMDEPHVQVVAQLLNQKLEEVEIQRP